MGDIAVRVENLSKLYRIGAKQESYKTFRDSITDAVTAPFKRVAGLLRGNAAAAANLNETIWALKDVSFEVKKGEVVGIIGRNGAGKSTLLKILSRITEPTSGEAKVYGRVGALLEVGTGFHPELTGRENIYLNGAILGMSREEIKHKFDEIVAFAEVEKFIDTPVKHYSSGMGLRLGFAVAAHLEPEILIVDEVLAVGDAAFQKKCLGKMSEVAGEGRTVLFVSHNMAAVSSLTTNSIWLSDGMVSRIGMSSQLIQEYLGSIEQLPSGAASFQSAGNTNNHLREFHIVHNGESSATVPMGAPVEFRMLVEGLGAISSPAVGIGIEHIEKGRILSLGTRLVGCEGLHPAVDEGVFVCYVDELILNKGTYFITVTISEGRRDLERFERCCKFWVTLEDVFHTGGTLSESQGVVFVPHQFRFIES
ncbi:MAG: ABC transporter ATP-binding protein [Anaerolineae bacterium]|nr:ABC transporter ATP-binding protein [Anaerolineae bacterium]